VRKLCPAVAGIAQVLVASDRLSEQEQAALRESFPGSPDLHAPLALGVWSELVLGPAVTPAFADLHIAPARLRPSAGWRWYSVTTAATHR
jgi:hypothetical protein